MSSAYLQCIEEACARRQDPKRDLHACEFCGGLLDVKYDFDNFDPEQLRRTWHQRRLSGEPIDRSGLWRFRELLPHVLAQNFANGFAPTGFGIVKAYDLVARPLSVQAAGRFPGHARAGSAGGPRSSA